MALSQIQCLDDNHVNPRTNESKPEFLYCEDQRLALEALLRDGREAFVKYLEARGLRCFLSDPELEALCGSVQPYDPGVDIYPGHAEDDEPPLSLHYWPELSDVSIPQLDLGWPDTDAYRGVTRATVYTQPPPDGQAHIKEIIRKIIAQAQKVIAVVMDVFTDVDIFRDLLDAAFKRKVSVYILLERRTLPHFLSMCHRTSMHTGHLKHLRVRCTDGADFHTRSCSRVRGRMGHRFMFVDGDKAVSGSYSFTWMSSRLDKNLITVLTGQVVDGFDQLFRILYTTSSFVDLRQVAKEPEPEPDPLPQPVTLALPPASVARKLYNPKYALVAACNPSPVSSDGNNSPKDSQDAVNSNAQEGQETNKKRRRRDVKEATKEAPLLHPGLTNLEKACLIDYLPTWPEPDPPSDVIGFINIRDSTKPPQVHLQRSEMFETSQAIRFSTPFSVPKETLPEVVKPRKIGAKHEENPAQPTQNETKAEEVVIQQAASKPVIVSLPEQKSQINVKALNAVCNLQPNTPEKQSSAYNSTSNISMPVSQQSSSMMTPVHATPTVPINSPKTDSLPKSVTETQAQTGTSLNTESTLFSTDLNSKTHQLAQPKKLLPHIISSKQDVNTKTHSSPENTSTQIPTNHISPSTAFASLNSGPVTSMSLSDSNQVCGTMVHSSMTSNACPPVLSLTSISTSPSVPPLSVSSMAHPLPSSTTTSYLTSSPLVPKQHTVQVLIKNTKDGHNRPGINAVSKTGGLPSTQVVTIHIEPVAKTVVQTQPEREPKTVSKLQNKTGTQKGMENTGKVCSPSQTSQEIKSKEVGLQNDRADTKASPGTKLQVQSNVLITDAPKENCMHIQETIPRQDGPLTSPDSNIAKKTVPLITSPLKNKDVGTMQSEENSNVVHCEEYLSRLTVPQRISHDLHAKDTAVMETLHSLNVKPDSPVSATLKVVRDRADDGTHTSTPDALNQHPLVSPAYHTDSIPDTTKHNAHNNLQDSQISPKTRGVTYTPERSRHLNLYDRSPTPERESRLLFFLARSSTPDGFSPCSPTPDSRSHTPDSHCYTPDFRTPTSDVSDGYYSPRADSALSTASEEFFECNDSPSYEPVFELASCFSHEDLSYTYANTTSSTSSTTSRSLCRHDAVSAFSLPEKEIQQQEGETMNVQNEKEHGVKNGNPTKRTERRSSKETKHTDHSKLRKASSELQLTEKEKVAQTQKAPRRKSSSNQQELGDEGVASGGSSNEAAEPMQMSISELNLNKISLEGERQTKRSPQKTVDRAVFRPSNVESRGMFQTTRQSERQKQQQRDVILFSPLRPPQPPRPPRSLLTAHNTSPRPWGSRHLNQPENKMIDSSLPVLDNISSSRRISSRPPPLSLSVNSSGSVASRKQAEISQSQQSPVYRQPTSAQARTRAGQSQNQTQPLKPRSFLHTHTHLQPQTLSQPLKQAASVQEGQGQEDGRTPFGITFSRLYNIKGLKDKVTKLPAQHKRSGTSAPAQTRKTTG